MRIEQRGKWQVTPHDRKERWRAWPTSLQLSPEQDKDMGTSPVDQF